MLLGVSQLRDVAQDEHTGTLQHCHTAHVHEEELWKCRGDSAPTLLMGNAQVLLEKWLFPLVLSPQTIFNHLILLSSQLIFWTSFTFSPKALWCISDQPDPVQKNSGECPNSAKRHWAHQVHIKSSLGFWGLFFFLEGGRGTLIRPTYQVQHRADA